jgi:altronate dehydratase large subunit
MTWPDGRGSRGRGPARRKSAKGEGRSIVTTRQRNAFLGFRRPDGTVGTRNHVLILAINGLVARAAARVAAALPGAVLVATPYGRGQLGADKLAHERQLTGLARNPNAGATLVVGADRATAERLAAAIEPAQRPLAVTTLDDVHEDALALSARGTRLAAQLARAASRMRRESAPVASLFLGVECGHSDATSGLIANPLAGRVVDRLIDAGARAVFGETLEWLGAEHVLARRAASPAAAEAIVAAVAGREQTLAATGVDLRADNPGAENLRGGLSTIEEKALGAIAKGGSRPIAGVLALAESPRDPGLYVMDAPAFSPESMTGFAAAGVQLMLFTTGVGNSFCNALAPTIKLSARPDTAAHLPEQIDFDASDVLAGRADLDAAAQRLYGLLLDTASGFLTWGEAVGETAEALARVGGSI